MKHIFLTVAILLMAGVMLQAATLELREYTVSGDAPVTGESKELDAYIDKGLIAFNTSLSLPIPPNGKISYQDTKEVRYGVNFGKNGLPKKTETRDVGTTVTGKVKEIKDTGGYEITFKYERTTVIGNQLTIIFGDKPLYESRFYVRSIESSVTMAPSNQWLIIPDFMPKSTNHEVIALKLAE